MARTSDRDSVTGVTRGPADDLDDDLDEYEDDYDAYDDEDDDDDLEVDDEYDDEDLSDDDDEDDDDDVEDEDEELADDEVDANDAEAEADEYDDDYDDDEYDDDYVDDDEYDDDEYDDDEDLDEEGAAVEHAAAVLVPRTAEGQVPAGAVSDRPEDTPSAPGPETLVQPAATVAESVDEELVATDGLDVEAEQAAADVTDSQPVVDEVPTSVHEAADQEPVATDADVVSETADAADAADASTEPTSTEPVEPEPTLGETPAVSDEPADDQEAGRVDATTEESAPVMDQARATPTGVPSAADTGAHDRRRRAIGFRPLSDTHSPRALDRPRSETSTRMRSWAQSPATGTRTRRPSHHEQAGSLSFDAGDPEIVGYDGGFMEDVLTSQSGPSDVDGPTASSAPPAHQEADATSASGGHDARTGAGDQPSPFLDNDHDSGLDAQPTPTEPEAPTPTLMDLVAGAGSASEDPDGQAAEESAAQEPAAAEAAADEATADEATADEAVAADATVDEPDAATADVAGAEGPLAAESAGEQPTPREPDAELAPAENGPIAVGAVATAEPDAVEPTPAEPAPAKETTPRKTIASKTTPRKTTPRKTTPSRKTTAQRTPATKTAAKRTPTTKTAETTPATKTAAKRTPTKRTATRKTAATQATPITTATPLVAESVTGPTAHEPLVTAPQTVDQPVAAAPALVETAPADQPTAPAVALAATTPPPTRPLTPAPADDRPRRRTPLFIAAAAVVMLLFGGILVAALNGRGHSSTSATRPTPSPTAAAPARVAFRPPVTLPADGSYSTSQILASGQVQVTEWIHSSQPLTRIRLAVPTDVLGLDSSSVRATGLQVAADQEQVDAPSTLATTAPVTVRFDAARDVMVTYELSGTSDQHGTDKGRALVRAIGLDVDYASTASLSSTEAVTGGQVLAMACQGRSAGATLTACGAPTSDGVWQVVLNGADVSDRVQAQLQLADR